MTFDRQKFKSLFHYVVWKAGKRDGFGATKLYKVLWFSEARTYVLTGKPITGAVYIREKHGPVPKLAVPIREELTKDGAIKAWKGKYYDYDMWRFEAKRPPNTSVFSEAELRAINYWIDHIDQDHTANSISDESHDYAWEIAKMGEELPYFAHLAERVRRPNDDELQEAKQRAAKLGLQ